MDLSVIIEQLAGEQVRRSRMIRAVNKLDNAAAAVVRRQLGWRYDTEEGERKKMNARAMAIRDKIYGGKAVAEADRYVAAAVEREVEVFRLSRDPLVKLRARCEAEMVKLARQLPVYPWVKSVRGFGELSLGIIVGEAGDLSNYPSDPTKDGVDCLWKRFGLTPHRSQSASAWRRKRRDAEEDALASLDDEGKPKKRPGLTKDEWIALGYRPERNAESFATLNNQQAMLGPYKAEYDRQKARFLAAGKRKMHAHEHGLRCMRKAMLEDLWRVWNGQEPKKRGDVEVPLEQAA